MSEYYTKARLFPTVLTMVPLVTFYIYYISPIVTPILEPVWNLLPVFTGVAINTVVMFMLVLLNRFLSKIIFQKILYQDDLKMPTTDYLLPGHPSLDKATRNRYYELIVHDFNIDMRKQLKSLKNEHDKRIMITRVVGQIRELLTGNKMLLHHNIEYGFFRNLVGGCVLASLISLTLLILAYCNGDDGMIATSLIMLIVYLLPMIFSKSIIKFHGDNYAKVLFEQYGVIKRN